MPTPALRMWGRFEHTLDDKGRVIVPTKFREKLGPECVITTGPNHHIRIYPQQVWNDLEDILLSDDAYGEMNSDLAFLQRMFGNSETAMVDQSFRLTLPRYLREWAEVLEGDMAVIIGNNNRLEIWNRQNWKEICSSFTEVRVDETMIRRKSNVPPPTTSVQLTTNEGGSAQE